MLHAAWKVGPDENASATFGRIGLLHSKGIRRHRNDALSCARASQAFDPMNQKRSTSTIA